MPRWRIRVALAAALALLGVFGLAGSAPADFLQVTSFDGSRTPAGTMVPERLSVDLSSGDVYVIDAADDVIDRFDRYGRYLSQLTGAQTTGGSFGFDNGDDNIAVDNSSNVATAGNVYVVGEGQGVISAFSRDGTFLWQADSGFPIPTQLSGVAVDPTSGDLWVADRSNGVVQLSPADGSHVGGPPFGASGTSSSLANLAFDSTGILYAGPFQSPLVKYTPPFADPPTATIDPHATLDVATDSTNDNVYVAHNSNVRVWDSTGTEDPSSPFSDAGGLTTGVAVDGPIDRIYIADDTSAVAIWSHNAVTMNALTVVVDGTGTGRVDADQGAIAGCTSSSGSCTGPYESTNTVTLTATATPDTGMVFAGWSGADAGACAGTTTDCVVTTDAAKSITATFNAPPQHRLTVSKSGSGSGTVTSSPAGINCGSTCSALFDEGTSVTLTATADQFSGWTGCDSVSGNRCTVDVTADKGVSATFTVSRPPTHTLSVSKAGDGSGSVTSSPAGIGCGATCSALFSEGTSVTLSAVPDAGSSFAGWSGGGCSGTSTCTVGLGSDASVTATFSKVIPSGGCPLDITQCPCPQDLAKCTQPAVKLGFSASSMLLRVRCTGFSGQTCRSKLTFKSVIKVRVRHGKKTKVVKKTITVATVSYSVAAGGTQSLKLKLTSAAKSALKSGGLTARAAGGFSIKLPKTKVRKKKKH